MTPNSGDKYQHPLHGTATVERTDPNGFVVLVFDENSNRPGHVVKMQPEVLDQWKRGTHGPEYSGRARPRSSGRITRGKR